MAEVFPLTAARSRLGELVNRARFGRERVILTEHGTPVAALISVDELAELQAATDGADLATVARIEAAGHTGIPHDQVMAALDALDAAELAESPSRAEAVLAPHRALLDDVERLAQADQSQ